MNRTELALTRIDAKLLERLVFAVENLADASSEPRCYPPAKAAELLGKSENWVVEAIQDRRIPFTYIGRTPMLTAKHIRWVQENGEVQPRALRAA